MPAARHRTILRGHPGKDITVVFNPAIPPTDEQVHESVGRVELDRWLGCQLRPELLVRTARGE